MILNIEKQEHSSVFKINIYFFINMFTMLYIYSQIDQSVLNNNMDYFLCGSLSTFKDVIGNMALSRTPILEYSDTTITALAAIEAEQIQVIIGTAKGNILKVNTSFLLKV